MRIYNRKKYRPVVMRMFILGFFLSLVATGVMTRGGLEAFAGENQEKPSDEAVETKDAKRGAVIKIIVEGAINPVTANYIKDSIEEAENTDASLLIIQLDTPGGLISSTRTIVKSMLGSKVPIVVHVAPPGSRAASAGLFITIAGHYAAMAPGTNTGAAHPVNVGGGGIFGKKKKEEEKEEGAEDGEKSKDEGEESSKQDVKEGKEADEKSKEEEPSLDNENIMAAKILNDTVAFIRSVAERNGRNADWAERAVRESVTATEREALELNIIDVVAENTAELLEKLDGRKKKISGEERTLVLSGVEVVERPMGLRFKVLAAIADPNIAYMLMMLGVYGIFFEIANPGVILPGVLGAIAIVLAFFSFQVIPINYAGFLLILLAVVLFILEVKVVSFGMLTVGGVVSMVLGSLMLFDRAEPYMRISLSLVLAVTIFTALFFIIGLGLVIKSMRRTPTTGSEGLLGKIGVASTDISLEGKIKVHGEIWSARSNVDIKAGESVKVEIVDGMVLVVAPEGESAASVQDDNSVQDDDQVNEDD